MIGITEWYNIYEGVNTGGQKSGKHELFNTSNKIAYMLASEHIPNIDDVIPNFIDNYKLVKDIGKIGKTKRKNMPVITSRDVKLFQQRLENGHIDIVEPYSVTTNTKNPFEVGLSGKKAKEWLSAGIHDGDDNDDKVNVFEKQVILSSLKPIQQQIYVDKSIGSIYDESKKITIESSKKFISTKTRFITSRDGYILDGHHRWLGGMLIDPSMKVNTISIDLPISVLLPLMVSYGINIGNKPNK